MPGFYRFKQNWGKPNRYIGKPIVQRGRSRSRRRVSNLKGNKLPKTFTFKIGRSNPIPEFMCARLKYSEYNTINPGAGVVGYQTYSANGVYDPNITGAGHQPMGFDQWMTFYEHANVINSKISVQFINTNTTTYNGGTMIVGINIDSDATLGNNEWSEIVEQPTTTFSYLECNGQTQTSTRLTRKLNVAKFFNKDIKSMCNTPEFSSTPSANPQEQVYWQVWAGAFDEASDPLVAPFAVIIEYDVVFTERKTLTQS